MFSLIITVISIALVAALALATLYYGGNAFNEGRARAEASKLHNHAQQLLGAADLFYVQKGRYPTSEAELVSEGFLDSVPIASAPANSVSAAMAATAWDMPVGGQPVFVLAGGQVDYEVCATFNEQGTLRLQGVPQLAHPELLTQCYGDETALKVVAQKSAGQVASVLSVTEVAAAGTIPVEGSPTGWSVAPASTGPVASPSTPNMTLPELTLDAYDGFNSYAFSTKFLVNNGAAPVTVGPLVLSGHINQTTGEAFVALLNDTCTGAVLNPGASCSFDIGAHGTHWNDPNDYRSTLPFALSVSVEGTLLTQSGVIYVSFA